MSMNWIKRIVGGQTGGKAGSPDRTPSIRGAPPPTRLIDSDETLVGEFTRARRYEQDLTIVVLTVVPLEESTGGPGSNGQAASNGDGAAGPDVLPLLAALGLREALRESDVMCYRPMHERFVLGLPQADGEEARQAMVRVGELFRRRLQIGLVAGIASFPDDGLTLEDLENTALGRVESVEARASSVGSGDERPPRDIPPRRARARDRVRTSRTGAPPEVAREALGSE